MTEYKISLMPGDGIGPELTEATLKVLDVVQKKFGIKLVMVQADAGDAVLKKHGRSPTRGQPTNNQRLPSLPKRSSRRNRSRRHSQTTPTIRPIRKHTPTKSVSQMCQLLPLT